MTFNQYSDKSIEKIETNKNSQSNIIYKSVQVPIAHKIQKPDSIPQVKVFIICLLINTY